jgi:hypothetical protein
MDSLTVRELASAAAAIAEPNAAVSNKVMPAIIA